ncbi:GNAT family N-acetyltransferase [Hyphomicrobium sulfonivorans]|nr:GNAT family N-acetyltransferase [Hyphomicrobium sulfonivorans]
MLHMNIIRPYAGSDMAACLRLFDGNVPRFFAASERQDFAAFLERLPGKTYLVVERDHIVVACGGHMVETGGETAALCWGMVDHNLQGNGIGRLLTEARLNAVRAEGGVKRVKLDTSQHTRDFYARFGFRAEAVVKDGYGPGLDRWDMLLEF